MPRMISQLESVVIGVNDLAAAASDYEELLGQMRHESMFQGEESMSFQLANTCLRLVETSQPQGLQQLVFGCPDISAVKQRLDNVGIEMLGDSADSAVVALNPDTTRGVNFALSAARDVAPQTLQSEGALAGLDHAVIASGNGDFTSALLSGR